MDTATEYRLAPALVARSAGVALVLLSLVVLAATAVTAAAHWSPTVVVVVAATGLVALLAAWWWATRRAYVVRLDRLGYEVRLVRGAGVKRARWTDVEEAATMEVRGVPCVVLSLRDGRSTSIPVALLAGDRDEFVARLRALVRR